MKKFSIVLSSIFLLLSLAITTKIVLASEESSVVINGRLVPLEESSSTSSSSQSSTGTTISYTVGTTTLESNLPNLGAESVDKRLMAIGFSIVGCILLSYGFKRKLRV